MLPEKPFHRFPAKEILAVDKKFLLTITKLDSRERPTVADLLGDVWFMEEFKDTRVPFKSEEVDRRDVCPLHCVFIPTWIS